MTQDENLFSGIPYFFVYLHIFRCYRFIKLCLKNQNFDTNIQELNAISRQSCIITLYDYKFNGKVVWETNSPDLA